MRRLKHPSAADQLDAQIAAMPKTKKRKPSAQRTLDNALVEMEVYKETGDWSTAKPMHYVALYAWLHTSIYETEPLDLLEGKSLLAASSAAKKMLDVDFDNEGKRFVEFIAWCWRRERIATKKGSGRRLSWRLQFASRHLLVDYRVDLMRAGR